MLDGHWVHTDRQVDLFDFDLVPLPTREDRWYAYNQQLEDREVEDLLGRDVAIVNGNLKFLEIHTEPRGYFVVDAVSP